MVEITVLPSQPAPQRITVRQACDSLGEHYQAFLAANNLKGYVDDPDRLLSIDKIGDLILLAMLSTHLTRDEYNWYLSRLQELSNGLLSNSRAKIVLRQALGYNRTQPIKYDADGNFVNRLHATRRSAARAHLVEGIGSPPVIEKYIQGLAEDHPLKLVDLNLRSSTGLNRQQAYDFASSLRDVSYKRIKLGRAYEYVAHRLGYSNWRELNAIYKEDPDALAPRK